MTFVTTFSARKFTFRWLPSHIGFWPEWPHRHKAIENFPSTITRLGPFSLETISTFGIAIPESPGAA
jgi:hypothetical protein